MFTFSCQDNVHVDELSRDFSTRTYVHVLMSGQTFTSRLIYTAHLRINQIFLL